METLSDIGMKIKQEPSEDSFCEIELSKNNQGVSTDSDHVTSVQEEVRYKRKVIDEVEQSCEKRRRSVSEASDVEIFGGDYGRETAISDANVNMTSRNTSDGCGKFQCLLCDEGFGAEDELMVHLSLVHKHNSQSRRQPSRFARHTCQVCYARFRTLKDFFNHTSCHASHPSMSSIDRDISTRVSNNLSKNALQRYFLNVSNFSRELLQPTFKCDCCNTVFVNRDAYAMHVMMRVKNESCKVTCDDSFGEVMGLNAAKSINHDDMKSPSSVPNSSSDDSKSKPDNCSPAELHQAFYVDVTSSADRDEYLQSVLEKSNNNTDSQHVENSKLVLKDGRKCMLCHEIFTDQDALAMHVMSHHSNDLSSPTSSNGSSNHYNSNKTPSPTPSHILKYFAPFANDRLLTLQTEVLYCEYCGQSFVNRDTLAMHVLSHAHEQETSESIGLNTLRMAQKTFEANDVTNLQSLTENHMKVLRAHNEEPLNLMTTQRSRSMTQDFQRKESEKENNETCRISSGNKIIDEFKKSKHGKIDKISVESNKTNKDLGDNQLKKGQTDKQVFVLGASQTFADPNRERSASVPSTKELNVECAQRAASVGCLVEKIDFGLNEKSAETEIQAEKGNTCSRLIETSKSNEKSSRSNESKVVPPEKHKNNNMLSNLKRRTSEGNSLEDLLGFGKHSPTLTLRDERSCPMALTDGKEPGKIEMLLKGKDIHVCKYCEIIFPSRTLYYLHMGLHNVNTPWQCNMCGKVCANVHDFNAHVIHL